MQHLTDAVQDLPSYTAWLLRGQNLAWFILALAIFLLCLFLNGTLGRVLRTIGVLFLIIDAVVSAAVYRNYPHVLICAAAILLLAAVRLLIHIIKEVRLSRRNRRIERVALARAAMRRGEHKRDFGTAVGEAADGTQAAEDTALSRTAVKEKLAELDRQAGEGELSPDELSRRKSELYAKLG